MSIKIFANHAHIFPESVRENGTLDCLKKIMCSCGIEKSVVFAPFAEFVRNRDIHPNRWLHEEIKNDDRFCGFGIIDFSGNNVEDQVEEIYQYGFKGIKLHPAFQKFRIDGEKAGRVYGRAQELGLFISFHTGIHWHRISDYNMLLFDEVAFQYPRLKFSMEHLGGYCFFKEGLAVMLNNSRGTPYPRIFAGLTSVFDRKENKPWFLNDQQIKDLIWQTGEDSAIFGLDFPYNGEDKISYAIGHILELDIPDTAKQKILGANLSAALSLDNL